MPKKPACRTPRRRISLAGTTALTTAMALLPVNASVAMDPAVPMAGPCAVAPGGGFDEGPPGEDALRPEGHRKAVMLMVDFPDLPARSPAARRASFFSDYGDAYLQHSSYGRYRLGLEPTPDWIRMPRPWPSYGIDRGNPPEVTRAYVEDAIEAAREQQGTDFDDTDLVYVVADDNVPAAPTVSQAGTFPGLRAGDHELRGAALVFGRRQDSALWQRGNFVHEAHHLYGLPDLYNVARNASVEWAGGWDTMSMAGISDLLGWHKWKLGWLRNDQVDCISVPGTSRHRLTPVGASEDTRIAVVKVSGSRAVVAEARTRRGLDRDICAEGVLLYTVDSSLSTGRGPVRVTDARPHSGGGRACADREPAELAELSDAPFRPGEGHTFTDGVRVQVEDAHDGGYSIRVTRR